MVDLPNNFYRKFSILRDTVVGVLFILFNLFAVLCTKLINNVRV